jgi:hypothetical protein
MQSLPQLLMQRMFLLFLLLFDWWVSREQLSTSLE